MMSVFQKCVFFAISVFCVSRGVVTLNISLEVPDEVPVRQSITRLSCSYDLMRGDTLYSVKWFKDDLEFYRYVPSDVPPVQFFPVQGVDDIDLSRSRNGTLYITDITPMSAGEYKCEVSTDAPTFRTKAASKYMSVKSRPRMKSSGHCKVDRSTVNMLLVTIFSVLLYRNLVWG